MTLQRLLFRKWSRIWRTKMSVFEDFRFQFTVLQKKEKYNSFLVPTFCQYSNDASQCRYVALFSAKNKKPGIPPALKNVRNCFSSALYINRAEEDRTPVVNVDLNLMERLHDVTELQQNLSARKMEMNVLELAEDFKMLMKLEIEKNQLGEKKKDITDMMAALLKVKGEDDSIKRSREILRSQGKALKEVLKSLNKDYKKLEISLMFRGLYLPNVLHKDTPLDEVIILQESASPNDFPVADTDKNHINIGQKLNWLKFSDVGPGAYYLKGKLAWLEQDWIYQFSQNMNEVGFFQLSCPEIFRTLVVEGCGFDYKSSDKIYTLQNNDVETDVKVEHLSHFVGVSSMSFAAYLIRMELKSEDLPLRYFTIGKSYQPASPCFTDFGLYAASQTTKCEVCCVCVGQTQADLEFKELVHTLWHWYSALELPLRLVLLPAADLHVSEMKKIVIEAWAPSLHKYLQVGSVSSTGVYISQRLMISHSAVSSEPEAVSLVHAEFLNISKLLAFLVEYGKISNDQSYFQLPMLPRRAVC